MNRGASLRRYGLALSAAVVAVLLLATLLFASSAQSSGRHQNADHSDGRMAIRSSEESVFSPPAGLPAAAGSNSINDGTAEALRGTDTTEATHPLSDNPFRQRQSADRPSVDSSPVMFIESVGQFDERARFQVRGGLVTMWLAEDAIWITVLERPDKETRGPGGKETRGSGAEEPLFLSPSDLASPSPQRGVNLKLTFPGANPHPRIEPFDRPDTVVSYFIGNDPAKWHPAVPVWAGVRYVDLYPGVDLELGSQDGHWTWRLAARTPSPALPLSGGGGTDVHLRIEGAGALTLAGDRLRLTTAVGEFSLPLPVADFSFQVEGVMTDGGQTTLSVQRVTPAAVSAVVPQDNPDDLLYSTFVGGSDWEESGAIAVDGVGNAYVTGRTHSFDFPITPGAFDASLGGVGDAFVVKVNAGGTGLTYATFLGGGGAEVGSDVIVDGTGNAYVTGWTRSSNFPTTSEAFDTSYNGGDNDVFIAKVDAGGTDLTYATFLGGGSADKGSDITLDGTGNAYVTGWTRSSNFPTTSEAFDTSYNGGDGDAFAVKLNTSGTALDYATFLGGSSADGGNGIAVDGTGSAYVTGGTTSSDFPTTPGAFDTNCSSCSNDADVFVTKLNAGGTGLVYSTFLGGGDYDLGYAVAVDGEGNTYVTGETGSSDFPTTPGAFDASLGIGDAFVVKVNVGGTGLAYATFLGGRNGDNGYAIAVDAAGSAYVAGFTDSSDFPTTPGAFDSSLNAYWDAFIAKLNGAGSALDYATFLGGSKIECFNSRTCDIAVDGSGAVYALVWTESPDFPTTPGAFDTSHNGSMDVAVAKLALGGGVVTYSISGRVLDSSGNTLSDVIISDGAGHTTSTGSDGNYTLAGLAAGTYTITPSKSGYAFSPTTRVVSVPPDATGQDFEGTPTYSISGHVLDSSGNSISDVTISDGAGHTTTTGSDGSYTLAGLAAGTYTITPSKDGYTFCPLSRQSSVPPNATAQDFTATPGPSLCITNIEVTQGIQCLNNPNCFGRAHQDWCPGGNCDNAVPLLLNKPTWVRVYIKSQQRDGVGVTGLLKGFYADGTDLPQSPLLYSPGGIVAHTNGGNRGNSNDTLNFQLPIEWTRQDTITLEARIYPVGPGRSTSVDSKRIDVTFKERSPLHVYSWRFQFSNGEVASAEEARAATVFMARVYPTDVIVITDQGELPTEARTWEHLTSVLADAWTRYKNRHPDLYIPPTTKVYGWVPEGENIASYRYFGWTNHGVSVGYIHRPPVNGEHNLAPQYIMAHEIGHTLPPINHVATVTETGGCAATHGGQYEREFPNTTGSIGEYGFWGNETVQEIYTPEQPDRYYDFMSYCGVNNNHQWVSPYTYKHLYEAIGAPGLAVTELAMSSSTQEYLVASGVISPDDSVTLYPFYREIYRTGTDDSPGSGPYSIELQDAQGNVLFTRFFDQQAAELPAEGAPVQFFEVLPFPSETSRILIKHNTTVLHEVSPSPNIPQVTVLAPSPGQIVDGMLEITWMGSDADSDPLQYAVEYSTDGGNTWRPIGVHLTNTALVVNTENLPGTDQAKVMISASDGINTGIGESGLFTVARKLPEVTILSPQNGVIIDPEKWIHLSGSAEDREDGLLMDTALVWTLDGVTQIGTGKQLTLFNLSQGVHVITLTATDSDGSVSTATAQVRVTFPEDVVRDCRIDVLDVQAMAARWRQVTGSPYDLDTDGQVTIVDVMQVAARWGDTCP